TNLQLNPVPIYTKFWTVSIEKLDDTVTSCNVKQKILYITGKLTTPVIVFNCVGNQVISTQEPIIDLSLLPTGIYIVKANHQTFKIINK
ncbi:hypothetical protein, partial [Barnesiella intestinihominis]|uniref:hypothetical protein n=1 Tax=Barnesiella intestinihominis TaxID=487174 RepID=UPI004028BA2C